MTDYVGTKNRLWMAIWEHAGDAIDKVLKETWEDGYQHGFEYGYDKKQEEVKDDNWNQGTPGRSS